jgi:hypothetical protein
MTYKLIKVLSLLPVASSVWWCFVSYRFIAQSLFNYSQSNAATSGLLVSTLSKSHHQIGPFLCNCSPGRCGYSWNLGQVNLVAFVKHRKRLDKV